MLACKYLREYLYTNDANERLMIMNELLANIEKKNNNDLINSLYRINEVSKDGFEIYNIECLAHIINNICKKG